MSSQFLNKAEKQCARSSFPRRRESKTSLARGKRIWIPAFAGMTGRTFYQGITLSALLGMALLVSSCSKGGGPGGGFSVQVVAEKAVAEEIDEMIPLVGTLTANEAVEIRSETEGKVEKVNFSEGQYVSKDRILFVIEGAKLTAQVAQAEATFNLSKTNLERSEALVQNNTISQQEYDQAVSRFEAEKAALDIMRQDLRDATVEAPFGGRVGARLVSPGQVVSRGTPLTTLVDSNPMKVEFNVPERYAGKLEKGLKMDIRVSPFPDRTFEGEVYFVSPSIDSETRTVLVKAKIPNPKGELKPGLFANVDLKLGAIKDAVTVSESALLKSLDSVQLFVVGEGNVAEARDVEVGTRLDGRAHILTGVKAGEMVIVEGVQKLGPGVPVSFENKEKEMAESVDQESSEEQVVKSTESASSQKMDKPSDPQS